MGQFLDMKQAYPEHLLFFRMGDFYEMFFEDAVRAAEALGIALTKRGTHNGQPIPMCGVPMHSAERYLHDLIRQGFKVAIAEQMEDPKEAKKRGSKSVVKREVVRLVTPGTLTEDTLLEAGAHNYLAAFAQIREDAALAWVDASTGLLQVTSCAASDLPSLLARLHPAEVLARAPASPDLLALIEEHGAAASELAPASFDPKAGGARVAKALGAASLDAFGSFAPAERAALGALIDYLELTQRGALPLLRPPQREERGTGLRIDPATRRNLEITRTLAGEKSGTLLAVLDRTVTNAGARLLEAQLSAPLTDLAQIEARLEAVAFLLDAPMLRDDLRKALRAAPDLERALTRLALGRGGPRDLGMLRGGLRAAADLCTLLETAEEKGALIPALIARARTGLGGHEALLLKLESGLAEELPLKLGEGGSFRPGYHADLDATLALRDDSRRVILELEAQYRRDTEIGALKIKHNNVLGWFVETSTTHAQKMLSPSMAEAFIHRQTTANAVRFTTVELSELEAKIARAAERVAEIERELFEDLRSITLEQAEAITGSAQALARLDIAASLADLAETERWVRPKIDDSLSFSVKEGRHPVVEAALKAANEPGFVANSADLSGESDQGQPIWLLTGPNMAGKSTFLRQNALIAIMAQMGSFVPAAFAHIGLVDQIFSRVGASDDLARGRSTFMVEMVETAAILNQAGPRALVILDEIGRGTSTYDGLSIAWATLEHLHDVNRCRALFASHYHELTALATSLPGLSNATVAVREWQGEVVFLREVIPGAADRSYGVQVARLAGMPQAVVARARDLLERLESGQDSPAIRAQKLVDDLPLFSAVTAKEKEEQEAAPLLRLRALDPDAMTPREALDALYELKGLLGKD
ncbi:MAG: DNA mismatch repair protein MutS [Neomegalonema sp.]|nr:DNA mismatch repair protein MutS [Neomegalonema sp.]